MEGTTDKMKRQHLVESIAILILLLGCVEKAAATNWTELAPFPRFVLYIDLDSVTWRGSDEVEVTQMTKLTLEGKAYFRKGYERLEIEEQPPDAVVTRESYFRNRHYRTLSVAYLDGEGKPILRTDQVGLVGAIPPGSLYEAVWERLFVPREPDSARASWPSYDPFLEQHRNEKGEKHWRLESVIAGRVSPSNPFWRIRP
jgi:hypothetical protein